MRISTLNDKVGFLKLPLKQNERRGVSLKKVGEDDKGLSLIKKASLILLKIPLLKSIEKIVI